MGRLRPWDGLPPEATATIPGPLPGWVGLDEPDEGINRAPPAATRTAAKTSPTHPPALPAPGGAGGPPPAFRPGLAGPAPAPGRGRGERHPGPGTEPGPARPLRPGRGGRRGRQQP